MTPLVPGLSMRDSQILELLRGDVPVTRIVDIGRHRKSWTERHVGTVVAYHLNTPPTRLAAVPPLPPPPKVAACGTLSGYSRHYRHHEKPCIACAERREKKSEERSRFGAPVWTPPPFTGRATDVTLTPAQVDVLERLCRGLPNSRIGRELDVAEDTVKSHVKCILAAVGATDRTHAVVIVLTGAVRVLGESRRVAS